MKKLLHQIMPFFLIGFVLVAFSFGIVLFIYLLFFGAICGFTIFFISWIRRKFFAAKIPPKSPSKSGRIIDSDDWKEL